MDTDSSDDDVHSNLWSKHYLPSNSFDNEDETKLVTYKTIAEETAFLQSIDKEENNQKTKPLTIWMRKSIEQNDSEIYKCNTVECFDSMADILRPKKRIKVEDLSTIPKGNSSVSTQKD